MTDSDAVRRVGLALPRTYERQVRGRWKLRVGQIVYVAFSRDEPTMGFGFPKAERDGLIASDPETFFLPPTSDLRYQWVCAHLPRLDEQEMRELVTDAWRMCTPRMLHDLPDLPAPAMAAYGFLDAGEYGELRPLLHPYVHFTDGAVSLRGRTNVLDHLREHRAKPPTSGRGPGRADLPLGAVTSRVRPAVPVALRSRRPPTSRCPPRWSRRSGSCARRREGGRGSPGRGRGRPEECRRACRSSS